jgi:hypothetical protein
MNSTECEGHETYNGPHLRPGRSYCVGACTEQTVDDEQRDRLARVRLEDELGTLRHAEQIARAHGQDKLADEIYGFGCSLGSSGTS